MGSFLGWCPRGVLLHFLEGRTGKSVWTANQLHRYWPACRGQCGLFIFNGEDYLGIFFFLIIGLFFFKFLFISIYFWLCWVFVSV